MINFTHIAPMQPAPADLSFLHLFLQAGWVVKSVIIMLAVASVWCWVVFFDKYSRFKRIRGKTRTFEQAFWASESVDRFYEEVKKNADHPMATMFLAGMREWYRSKKQEGGIPKDDGFAPGLKERMFQTMSIARNRDLEKLESQIGFLATVGSTAPFIGLFGTVWGIMDSFQSIAAAKNATLAVVAPGIAEALFATAIGLFAAIPAVIFYNKFSGELSFLAGKLEDFSSELVALFSRQLDKGEH